MDQIQLFLTGKLILMENILNGKLTLAALFHYTEPVLYTTVCL